MVTAICQHATAQIALVPVTAGRQYKVKFVWSTFECIESGAGMCQWVLQFEVIFEMGQLVV